MRLFRIAWKVVAIIGWMLYVATICIIAQGRGWRGVRRATYFSNLWGRGMCRIIKIRLESSENWLIRGVGCLSPTILDI